MLDRTCDFEEIFYFTEYTPGAIAMKKFFDKPTLRWITYMAVSKYFEMFPDYTEFDFLAVPPPSKAKKGKFYLPAETGKLFAKAVGAEFRVNYLYRVYVAEQQKTLDAFDRVTNTFNAFALRKKYIPKMKDKRIMLFDDISSTGSTLAEMERIFIEAGAKYVRKAVLFAPFDSD